MIREQEVIRCATAHPFSHAGSTGVIVFLHRAGRARPLKIIADIGRRHAAHHALDAVAVAIIHKRGRSRPADRGHAVLGVIRVAGAPRAHHNSLILRSRLLDATPFYPLTFMTVSTCISNNLVSRN